MATRRGTAASDKQREQWAAERRAKLADLHERVVAEVGKITDSDQWRRWPDIDVPGGSAFTDVMPQLLEGQAPAGLYDQQLQAYDDIRVVGTGTARVSLDRTVLDEPEPIGAAVPAATPSATDAPAGR